MSKIIYKQLSEVAKYRNDRISIELLTENSYISTENMIQDRGGVTIAASIPESNTVSKFDKSDILLSNIRPYFKKIWHANRIGGCSNDVLVVKPQKNINPRFLYYVLSDSNFFNYATVTSKGTKMPRGSKQAIMKYLVPDVDLPTQTRIADILSTYDDLIENNNRRIELLEKAAQELYKEWFVRFRFPNHEKTKFVNGLPVGWEVKPLGDIIDIGSSKRVYLSDYVESGIPFYRSKEIIQLSEGQTVSDPLYIDTDKFEEFSNKFGAPLKNDILITSVGTIGESYLSDGHTFYFKDGNLTWLKTSKSPMLAILVFCWLNTDAGKQTLYGATIGTSQSALTIDSLRKIKICVPDDKTLEAFYKSVIVLKEEKSIIQKKNQNLKKQRDLLLPRLMSGRLEV